MTLAYSPGLTHQTPRIPPSGKQDLQPGKQEATAMLNNPPADNIAGQPHGGARAMADEPPKHFDSVTQEDLQAVLDRAEAEIQSGAVSTRGIAQSLGVLAKVLLAGGKVKPPEEAKREPQPGDKPGDKPGGGASHR